MLRLLMLSLLSLSLLCSNSHTQAKVDFRGATKVGSWVDMEEEITNHKGKKSFKVNHIAVVGEELFEGQPHIWVEIETRHFSEKKGKRRQEGDVSISKTLLNKQIFTTNPQEAFSQLPSLAKTMITQNGDSDPMQIDAGGAIAKTVLDASGFKNNADFKEQGKKKMSTPAGEFNCHILVAKGSATAKVVFKKFKTDYTLTQCLSNKVPFWLVHAVYDEVTNGKKSVTQTRLLKFGLSGAKTKITKTPEKIPELELPSLKDLFR